MEKKLFVICHAATADSPLSVCNTFLSLFNFSFLNKKKSGGELLYGNKAKSE